MSGQWECVACGYSIRAGDGPLWRAGWLCERGGRICRRCLERLEAAGPGASADLGAGVRLVMTEGDRL